MLEIKHHTNTWVQLFLDTCCVFVFIFISQLEIYQDTSHYWSVLLYISESLQCHCGRTYRSKIGLLLHKRKHSLNFPFRCEYCDKGFSSKRDLSEHLTRHTGTPVAICRICGFEAMSYNGLKGHMNRHENRTFQCVYCQKRYYAKKILNRHIKTFHKVE